MKDLTRDNVGKRMAILLFEKGKGEVITAPVIRSELGSHFQISGRMTRRGKRHRAAAARRFAGCADGHHRREDDRPEPGRREHHEGLSTACCRVRRDSRLHVPVLPAVRRVLDAALGFNLLLLLAVLSMLQATLSLPGIAAIALTLGMAIDCERADQRARARGTARRRLAAGRDPHRLRARLGDDPGLERDDADCRAGAAGVRLGTVPRLRGRALPRHPDLDVLGVVFSRGS
jgi:preprotein translocase subunit SecD